MGQRNRVSYARVRAATRFFVKNPVSLVGVPKS